MKAIATAPLIRDEAIADCIAAAEALGPDLWNDGSDTRIESVLGILRDLLERREV